MGFVRDVLVASTLGAGPVADAFVVAFRLPNLFRRLFAEGAFNSAFVPLYAKRVDAEGPSAAKAFAEDVLAVMFWSLAIFSAVMMLAMPFLVDVLAPGFINDSDKFALTVAYTRICFPYLLCMSVLAILGGVLNSNRKFGFAAWAPLLLNTILSVALITAGALGLAGTRQAGLFLCWAVFIAGFAQVALLAYILKRHGLGLSIKWPRMTPGVKRMLILGIPGVIAGGITQINLVIGTMIASTMPAAVSWLYYADRIYQFPLGMVGVAIGVVLLPELSRQMKMGDSHVLETQNRALEFSMLLTLPAAVALACVPHSIIAGLFERGAFGPFDSAIVSGVLAAFAFGLPAFVLTKVLSPAFFAREDTKRPMLVAMTSSATNVIFSLLLFKPYGPMGIAAATVIAGWVDALLLLLLLWRKKSFKADSLLLRRLLAILAASLLMGAALLWGDQFAAPHVGSEHGLTTKFIALAVLCGSGFLIYVASVFAFGGIDRKALSSFMKQRALRKGEAPPSMEI
jgi:putative peptidoglycan lipid II flippase